MGGDLWGEAVGLEPKQRQRGEQGMAALLTPAQASDAVPVAVVTGAVTVCRDRAPVIGSWPIRWTPSRRRLAVSPISRSTVCRVGSRNGARAARWRGAR